MNQTITNPAPGVTMYSNPSGPSAADIDAANKANAGASANAGMTPYQMSVQGVGSGASSPTVMTNANILEKTIPETMQKASSLIQPTSNYQTGTYTNKEGMTTTGNPTALASLYGGTPADWTNTGNDPWGKEVGDGKPSSDELALIGEMKKNVDAQTAASLSRIESGYKVRTEALKTLQANRKQNETAALLMSGGLQHDPIGSSNALSENEKNDLFALSELQDKEEEAKQGVLKAQSDQNFQLMEKQLGIYQKAREQKLDYAKTITTKMADENKKIRDKTIQSSRDSAIANVVNQGITDPKKILETLNMKDGKQVGDFTSKEVADVMKNISGDGDINKLTGNIRDFQILKKSGALPEAVSSLPEEQQMAAWLKFIKPTKTLGVGSVNKITLAEAQSKKLPMSVVGMSEADIAHSFDSETPPQWFTEKAQNEKKMSIKPDELNSMWQSYRDEYKTKFAADKTAEAKQAKETVSHDKAKKYFQETYGSALDEKSADTLAQYVQTYVDGGMSYAKAVAKVVKEAQ